MTRHLNEASSQWFFKWFSYSSLRSITSSRNWIDLLPVSKAWTKAFNARDNWRSGSWSDGVASWIQQMFHRLEKLSGRNLSQGDLARSIGLVASLFWSYFISIVGLIDRAWFKRLNLSYAFLIWTICKHWSEGIVCFRSYCRRNKLNWIKLIEMFQVKSSSTSNTRFLNQTKKSYSRVK